MTLGTDGPVSGNDLNSWFTLRLATILQKGSQLDSALFPAADMVAMVTCDAAQALHLGDRLGSIEPGKLADLITVRMDAVHAVPCYDPYALLVCSTGREDIDDVIINGNLVVRQQHLTNLNETQFLEQGRNIAQDVKRFMMSS